MIPAVVSTGQRLPEQHVEAAGPFRGPSRAPNAWMRRL
jgi:hypothetical protein